MRFAVLAMGDRDLSVCLALEASMPEGAGARSPKARGICFTFTVRKIKEGVSGVPSLVVLSVGGVSGCKEGGVKVLPGHAGLGAGKVSFSPPSRLRSDKEGVTTGFQTMSDKARGVGRGRRVIGKWCDGSAPDQAGQGLRRGTPARAGLE